MSCISEVGVSFCPWGAGTWEPLQALWSLLSHFDTLWRPLWLSEALKAPWSSEGEGLRGGRMAHMDKQKNARMDGWTHGNYPLCPTGHRLLRSCCLETTTMITTTIIRTTHGYFASLRYFSKKIYHTFVPDCLLTCYWYCCCCSYRCRFRLAQQQLQ